MSTRVTREDWLRAAHAALVDEGVEQVKIAPLAAHLDVARSSFYWYFTDREQLLAALLDEWEARNTHSLQQRAARPAATITEAVLGVFECWADPQLFDAPLEFAVREWARRDDSVRERLAAADAARLAALAAMHRRFGDDRKQALVRARVHFHSQLGLYATATTETHAERLRMLPAYVRVFTGAEASLAELRAFERFVAALERR